jgi:hypothetical protein
LGQAKKDSIKLAFGGSLQHRKFHPEGAGRRKHFSHLRIAKNGIGRIDEQRDDTCCRQQLVQQFQPFRRYLDIQLGDAGYVAARPVKAGDEAELNRVGRGFEYDRNGRRHGLCRQGRRRTTGNNCSGLSMDQIGHHRRQPIELIIRPAVFDRYILAFDITRLTQALAKRGRRKWYPIGCCAVEKSDDRHRRLLCTRRERARKRRASQAHTDNEFASPHARAPAGDQCIQTAICRIKSGNCGRRYSGNWSLRIGASLLTPA